VILKSQKEQLVNRLAVNLLFCVTLFFALIPQVSADAYQAGVHYEVLSDPVLTSDPSKIEVVDLFWYGCSHCYTFKTKLESWQKSQLEDVYFIGVPAVWQVEMRLHAKAYYTAQALKVFDLMHSAIFDAMNLKKEKLKSEAEIAALFVANGVQQENFSKIFNSGTIAMAADFAEKKQEKYRLRGTPEIVVNGKYRISGRSAGSQTEMLQVASFLIDKERTQLK
tara:strand:- start:184 stop:852 length:669 start_codon:yes stop_codon:yes gene_type:complete